MKLMAIPVVIVSGPGGVGKGAIKRALDLYGKLGLLDFNMKKVVMYNTRNSRPGEEEGEEYWFTSHPTDTDITDFEIREKHKVYLREYHARKSKGEKHDDPDLPEGLIFCKVRSDLQAIWLEDIKSAWESEGDVLYIEMFCKFREKLLDALKDESAFSILSIFIAPLTDWEIARRAREGNLPPSEVIRAEMRRRMRERRDVGLAAENEEKIEEKSCTAPMEIEASENYDAVIVNPFGEGDPAWGRSNVFPRVDAAAIVDTIARIISAHVKRAKR
jgi:hypothetical protein